MPKRSGNPRDVNAMARRIVDKATGDAEDPTHREAPSDPGKDPAAVALGRRGGLKGGKARAEKMSPEERSKAAKHAATMRWRAEKSRQKG